MRRAGLLAIAKAARALAELAEAEAEAVEHADAAMLSEAEAAKLAGVSVRTLRDARRDGELVFFGKQRSRTVRRADLERWIESRRVPVVRDVVDAEDADVSARMRRLERRHGSGGRAA